VVVLAVTLVEITELETDETVVATAKMEKIVTFRRKPN
jgi:hypothetical protein